MNKLDRWKLLAAETYSYSYDNYADHQFRDALEVVDAPTPAESFRRSVRQAIKRALADGMESEEQIEALVVQVCYRAADLSFLLRSRDEPLHKYSRLLRREPGVEYDDGA